MAGAAVSTEMTFVCLPTAWEEKSINWDFSWAGFDGNIAKLSLFISHLLNLGVGLLFIVIVWPLTFLNHHSGLPNQLQAAGHTEATSSPVCVFTVQPEYCHFSVLPSED